MSSTFRGGKKKYVFLIINHNSTDIWWAWIVICIVSLYCGYVLVILPFIRGVGAKNDIFYHLSDLRHVKCFNSINNKIFHYLLIKWIRHVNGYNSGQQVDIFSSTQNVTCFFRSTRGKTKYQCKETSQKNVGLIICLKTCLRCVGRVQSFRFCTTISLCSEFSR